MISFGLSELTRKYLKVSFSAYFITLIYHYVILPVDVELEMKSEQFLNSDLQFHWPIQSIFMNS